MQAPAEKPQLTFFIVRPDNDQVNRFAGVVILYPQYKQL